jgi:hypothetical protein
MATKKNRLEYCVAPVLVQDLTSQCAAHFIGWFIGNSDKHILDVLRCGLRGNGGLVEEVEYWFDRCTIEDSWDVEYDGPWVYDNIPPKDVAAVIWSHTKGWKLQDYRDYGYTKEDREQRDVAFAKVA